MESLISFIQSTPHLGDGIVAVLSFVFFFLIVVWMIEDHKEQ